MKIDRLHLGVLAVLAAVALSAGGWARSGAVSRAETGLEPTPLFIERFTLDEDYSASVSVGLTAIVRDASTDQDLRGLSIHLNLLHGSGLLAEIGFTDLVDPRGDAPVPFLVSGLDKSLVVPGLAGVSRPGCFDITLQPVDGLTWGDVDAMEDLAFASKVRETCCQ